jgi:hypothetical protein
MKITFELDLNGKRLTEQELRTDLKKLRQALIKAENLDGILRFEDRTPASRFELGDTLAPLIANLCFGPIAALAADETVDVEFFSCEARVRLEPAGKDVVISWEGEPPRKLPRAQLLPALVECGERYVDFVKRLHGSDPDWADEIKTLTEAAKKARSGLSAAS